MVAPRRPAQPHPHARPEPSPRSSARPRRGSAAARGRGRGSRPGLPARARSARRCRHWPWHRPVLFSTSRALSLGTRADGPASMAGSARPPTPSRPSEIGIRLLGAVDHPDRAAGEQGVEHGEQAEPGAAPRQDGGRRLDQPALHRRPTARRGREGRASRRDRAASASLVRSGSSRAARRAMRWSMPWVVASSTADQAPHRAVAVAVAAVDGRQIVHQALGLVEDEQGLDLRRGIGAVARDPEIDPEQGPVRRVQREGEPLRGRRPVMRLADIGEGLRP